MWWFLNSQPHRDYGPVFSLIDINNVEGVEKFLKLKIYSRKDAKKSKGANVNLCSFAFLSAFA
jgi:hypothetical protein